MRPLPGRRKRPRLGHVFHGSTRRASGLRESFLVEYRELIHRLLPVVRRAAPVGRDVAQRQPDQLVGRVVTREVAARFDDLAQPCIDALDRVGRVDHTWRTAEGNAKTGSVSSQSISALFVNNDTAPADRGALACCASQRCVQLVVVVDHIDASRVDMPDLDAETIGLVAYSQ